MLTREAAHWGWLSSWHDAEMYRPADKRLSFNEVPDIYDEIRPSYPSALYDALFEMLPQQPAIVEVGPVTGQATKDLLDRGASVHAIAIGPPAPTRDEVNPPLRMLLDGDDRFGEVEIRKWDWDQTYSAAEYRKLMLSYSGTQMMAAPDRLGLLDEMESFINEHFDRRITWPLVATLTTARLS